MFGRDIATEATENGLCSFCVRDALASSDPETALDVWGGGNTSASTIAYLQDSSTEQRAAQAMSDVKLMFDGEVFDLGGGAAKLGVGANMIRYNDDQLRRSPSVSGPASTSTQTIETDMDRDVTAFFAEMYLPFTDSIDVNLAVRSDDYSDFGSTVNPRIAAQWAITDSLKLRVTYAQSFIAPALTSRGEEPTGQTTESGWGAAPTGGFGSTYIGPDFQSPNIAAFLAWCQANYPGEYSATLGCRVGQTGAVTGTWVTGGNYGLNEETGDTFSIGFDLTNPDWAPGLRLSITYYDKLLEQMVTAPRISAISTVAGLNPRLLLLPTTAQVDAWTNGLQQTSIPDTHPGLPANVETPYLWSFQQVNAFNIDSAGFDVSTDYSWDTDMGDWVWAYSFNYKTRFDQQSGVGGEWQDFLNGNYNTTFSSLQYLHNMSIGWNSENMSAKLTWKYTNAYDRAGSAQTTIDASNIFNLYFSYDVEDWDTQFYFQSDNILDEDPPWWDTNGGFQSSDSSPIGRLMTVGFRKVF